MNKAIRMLSKRLPVLVTAGFTVCFIMLAVVFANRTAYAVSMFTYAEQESWKPITYLEMKPGDSIDLRFKGVPDYRNYTCSWSSSNEAVAKVDNVGLVTAVADGSAEIVLQIGDGSVYTSEPVSVTVSSMTVTAGTSSDHNLSVAELKVGESIDLNFYGIRDWGTRKAQYVSEWETSDASIAEVSQKDGMVTGVSKGTAVVVFRIYDTEKDILLNSTPVTVTVK